MIAAMSSLPAAQPSSTNLNQFIRPNAFNVHSAAERLASRGEGFANSVEFAEAISGGVATDLAQALMTGAAGGGTLTIGAPIGAALILGSWLLTGWYVRKANTEFDQLTHAIAERAK